MTYKHSCIISNVATFKVFSKNFAYLNRNNALYLNEEELYYQVEDFFFFDEKLCFHKQGKTIFLDLKVRQQKTLNKFFLYENYFDNTFLVSYDEKKEVNHKWSSKYAIYQLEPFVKIYELPSRYIGSGERYGNLYFLFSNEKLQIKCLSLVTGEYNWGVNIGLDKKIVNILGISDNKLVLTYEVDAQKPYGLAIIETNTGALMYDSLHNGLHPHRSTLRLASQTVFCCCMYAPERVPRNHYWEFDIKKQQISRRGFLIELDNLGLVIAGVNLQDDLLYFTADYKGQWANVIGVLDYHTLKLLWWQKVEMAEGAFFGNGHVPQVGEDKLYILDTKGTLHIFEKEEDSASSLPLSTEDLVPF